MPKLKIIPDDRAGREISAEDLGALVRAHMKTRGITQQDAAEELSVSQVTISDALLGSNNRTLAHLITHYGLGELLGLYYEIVLYDKKSDSQTLQIKD